jgi:transposase
MDDSVLVELFGKGPQIKIIDAFIEGIGEGWSKKEIQEMSGLSKATVLNNWEPIEKYGLIEIKRQFGNTKLYRLNIKSKIVKSIIQIEKELIELTSPNESKDIAKKASSAKIQREKILA